MFQWLSAVLGCINISYFKKAVSSRLLSAVFLALLAVQYSCTVFAGGSPPVWTIPVNQVSDDGYASLAWKSEKSDKPGLFKITESFKGEVTIHYTESTALRVWRVEPGEYQYVLQEIGRAHV